MKSEHFKTEGLDKYLHVKPQEEFIFSIPSLKLEAVSQYQHPFTFVLEVSSHSHIVESNFSL